MASKRKADSASCAANKITIVSTNESSRILSCTIDATPDEVHTLLNKILALCSVNEEIAQRIEADGDLLVRKNMRYYIGAHTDEKNKQTLLTLRASEIAVIMSSSKIIENWRLSSSITMTPIYDLFNEGLDMSVSTFADLKIFNQKLKNTAEKFRVVRSEFAIDELQKILENLEKIQVGLGDLELQMTSEESRIVEIQSVVAQVNTLLQSLLKHASPTHELYFSFPPHDYFCASRAMPNVLIEEGGLAARFAPLPSTPHVAICFGKFVAHRDRVAWVLQVTPGENIRFGVAVADSPFPPRPGELLQDSMTWGSSPPAALSLTMRERVEVRADFNNLDLSVHHNNVQLGSGKLAANTQYNLLVWLEAGASVRLISTLEF